MIVETPLKQELLFYTHGFQPGGMFTQGNNL